MPPAIATTATSSPPHASEVWLNPLGAVALAGPGGKNLYYKGLMDKLGVTANVYRVGTYKSAVEPYTRNDMSPEAKRECPGAGRGAARNLARSISRRARPKAAVDRAIFSDPVAALAAPAATSPRPRLRRGWSTSSANGEQFEARLAELGGEDEMRRGGFRSITLGVMSTRRSIRDADGPIGVVTVAGDDRRRQGRRRARRAAKPSPGRSNKGVATTA